MNAYLHTKSIRPDGSSDCHLTREVPIKHAPMPHHIAGLYFTATGYGARIPTEYMIEVEGRWRRVYCRIYSNSGTLFIGKKYDGTQRVHINE